MLPVCHMAAEVFPGYASSVGFRAVLWRYPGAGGWVFARIPGQHAPAVTHGWGRTPVTATVDGHTWETSVWSGKTGSLLAVPKRVRGTKGDGDRVTVSLVLRAAPLRRKKPRR
jgi:hypothetical protein